MAIDPYASCPCGSGKKFKWCCQEIHGEVDKAFEQHNAGQHEAALVTLKQLTDAHSGNPEAWGRYAQLLALNGKFEEAEQALDKAFGVNPGYAFGHFLRGQFRMNEGELVGALLLFRKATEAYSLDAAEPLGALYELIADLELRMNRPVAARAALRQAVRLRPTNAELKQTFDAMFGAASRLPACARADYTFRVNSPAPEGWKDLFEKAATGRLADARDAFVKWTESHPDDASGWFNLGLVRAWLGDNAGSAESLARYVDLETDEAKAAEAWALAAVQYCGDGLEDEADYAESRAIISVSDPNPVMALIQKWERERRLAGMRANPEQGLLTGLVLEAQTSLVETAAGPSTARLGAYMLVAGSMMQLWHPNAANVDKIVEEVQKAFGPSTPPVQRQLGPIMFSDVVADAMIFPTGATTELDAELKVREAATSYFEEKWIHQPLKALSGTAPIDAAGNPRLRRKLRGVIHFIQDCAAPTAVRLYDFDRLRRKLGLKEGGEAAGVTSTDFASMGTAELAGIAVEGLTEPQLADAFRAAIKLDAKEIAGKFAQALLASPALGADRWPFFNHLIAMAQAEGRFDDALSYVDDGEKADCESNEGRRRNDFELRRGQLLAKRGDGTGAADVFDRLVARAPDELKYLETATKSMLDLKVGEPARRFADQGLAKARAQNNRDAEEYFMDLVNSAKKLP